jgi:replicative DNA helicase
VARQADAELSGREQVEAAEGMLYELAETGAVSSGPRTFEHFLTSAIGMAAEAYGRDGGLSGSPPA